MGDQHGNQQQSPFNHHGYHHAPPPNFHSSLHYNFPPPPLHDLNFPPPVMGLPRFQPPPHVGAPYEPRTSYPPPIPHPFIPNYSPVNHYSHPVHYLPIQQPPVSSSPVSSDITTLVTKNQDSYQSHKPLTSKRPLPSKANHSSSKSYSTSSSAGRYGQKKTYRNPTSEDQLPSSAPEEYTSLTPEEIIENEKKTWTRCAPADLYYARDLENPRLMRGTEKLKCTIDRFKTILLERGENARMMQPNFDYPSRKNRKHSVQCGSCKEKSKKVLDSCSSTSDSSSSEEEDEVDLVLQELERKKQHPSRLHPELWFNDPGEMNDGPLCRCRFENIFSLYIYRQCCNHVF